MRFATIVMLAIAVLMRFAVGLTGGTFGANITIVMMVMWYDSMNQ